MIFEIDTVAYTYCTERKEKLEKLGFKFNKLDWKSPTCSDGRPLYMKDLDTRVIIEINTLDDLVNLGDAVDEELIINFERKLIRIYDDYES